jgi:hypothetical protein
MENIQTTELRKLADSLHLGEYPQGLEQAYEEVKNKNYPACDLALIDSLQEQYSVFGKYYEDVRKSAEEINADPVRSEWVRAAVKFVLSAPHDEAYKMPAPPQDGTLATDYLMMHLLIPQIPKSIAEYLRRGFTMEEIKESLRSYAGSTYMVGVLTGRPGINKLYYGWLTHYAKTRIFKTHGLQFELKKFPPTAIWLRNRQTKKVVPVMLLGTFHASGIQRLGSAGYEDADGSFRVTFTEDEENYIGHGAYNGKVSAEPETFPKAQWECVARPGDGCLNVHVPRGTDISEPTFRAAWDSARKIMKERFPEHGGGHIFAYSWIFDPVLTELLGEESTISKFQNLYARFPIKNNGRAVFTFVFPGYGDDFTKLPEKTSLQRKIKAMYLDGKYIYEYAGAVFGED